MTLSNILTNIRTIQIKRKEGSIWGNATWKKNTIMQVQSDQNFHAKRLETDAVIPVPVLTKGISNVVLPEIYAIPLLLASLK